MQTADLDTLVIDYITAHDSDWVPVEDVIDRLSKRPGIGRLKAGAIVQRLYDTGKLEILGATHPKVRVG